jgi:Zn-dependent peptidase ImmA (M78 family)
VQGRAPIRGLGVKAARVVRTAIGYVHPTELEIELIAYMRGALVRPSGARGARANLLRLGDKGIIAVADSLSPEERRWAIAHELGHFEAHAGLSFLGLCTGIDIVRVSTSTP